MSNRVRAAICSSIEDKVLTVLFRSKRVTEEYVQSLPQYSDPLMAKNDFFTEGAKSLAVQSAVRWMKKRKGSMRQNNSRV